MHPAEQRSSEELLGCQVISTVVSSAGGLSIEPAVWVLPASKRSPWGRAESYHFFLGWPCPGACGILVLPTRVTRGLNPCPLQWGVLTTGPPGKTPKKEHVILT